MATKSFALEPGGAKRVELSWTFGWNDFVAKLDGKVLANAGGTEELKAGLIIGLPEGGHLTVRLLSGFSGMTLEVTKDGQPLPGSGTDPLHVIKVSAGAVFFVAAIYFLLGVLGVVLRGAFLQQFGFSTIIVGAVMALCGFFTMRRSRIALAIAMTLYAIDGAIGLALTFGQGQTPALAGIAVRVVLLIAMGRGFRAIAELNRTAAPPVVAA